MRTILISLVLLFMSVMGNAQSLTLKIGGIENAEGFLYVGIYSSEESFMKNQISDWRLTEMQTQCFQSMNLARFWMDTR